MPSTFVNTVRYIGATRQAFLMFQPQCALSHVGDLIIVKASVVSHYNMIVYILPNATGVIEPHRIICIEVEFMVRAVKRVVKRSDEFSVHVGFIVAFG